MDVINDVSIMFVDDEEDLLEIMRNQFAAYIADISTASTPDKAMEIARSKRIDLVILDINMPTMDGVTLLTELKKINPEIGSIFLTGYAQKETAQAALRLGAFDLIDKPFDRAAFRNIILRACQKIGYDRLLNEILELFVLGYTKIDIQKYATLSHDEKEKTLKAALGVARMKIANKSMAK